MCIQLLNHSLEKPTVERLRNLWLNQRVTGLCYFTRRETQHLVADTGSWPLWTFTTTAPVSRSQFMCKKGLEQPFKKQPSKAVQANKSPFKLGRKVTCVWKAFVRKTPNPSNYTRSPKKWLSVSCYWRHKYVNEGQWLVLLCKDYPWSAAKKCVEKNKAL